MQPLMYFIQFRLQETLSLKEALKLPLFAVSQPENR